MSSGPGAFQPVGLPHTEMVRLIDLARQHQPPATGPRVCAVCGPNHPHPCRIRRNALYQLGIAGVDPDQPL